jgi:hypothetical protein
VQLQLDHRDVEELKTSATLKEEQLDSVQSDRDRLAHQLGGIERLLQSSERARTALDGALRDEARRRESAEQEVRSLRAVLEQTREAVKTEHRAEMARWEEARALIQSLEGERSAVTARLREVLDSRSWRWTEPVRSALRRFYAN